MHLFFSLFLCAEENNVSAPRGGKILCERVWPEKTMVTFFEGTVLNFEYASILVLVDS